MKKLFRILVTVILLPLLTGCGGDLNPFEDGHHRVKKEKEGPVMKRIKMSFGGDFISESEEPLQRAEDGDTYVAINVYRAEKTENGPTNKMRYAYGLFKGKDDISIDLVTGYVYTFNATILIENRDKVVIPNDLFEDPFVMNNGNVSLSQFIKAKEKVFVYHDDGLPNSDRPYFNQLKSGLAMVDISESTNDSEKNIKLSRYPRVKRFYGELENFDPSGIISEVDIPMIYKSFGLKFVVGSIPNDTYVTVKDITTYTGSDPGDYKKLVFTRGLTLGNNANDLQSWEGIYSINDFSSESQKFKLLFTWHRLSGSDEDFDHEVTVNVRKLKVLTLNVEGDPGEVSETKSGNITFTMSDQWEEADENYNETVSNKKKD